MCLGFAYFGDNVMVETKEKCKTVPNRKHVKITRCHKSHAFKCEPLFHSQVVAAVCSTVKSFYLTLCYTFVGNKSSKNSNNCRM